MAESPCLMQGLFLWHKQFRRQHIPNPQESDINPETDVESTVKMAV